MSRFSYAELVERVCMTMKTYDYRDVLRELYKLERSQGKGRYMHLPSEVRVQRILSRGGFSRVVRRPIRRPTIYRYRGHSII